MINENREHIIINDNTAQVVFNNFIDSLAKPIHKIIIDEPLSGDIDLNILIEINKGIPSEIIFSKGNITNIFNIPDGIITLKCSENMIISFNKLPISLKTLECDNNYIESINISNLINLETLNISHNNIIQLNEIPNSIVNLICTHNHIRTLDLNGLINLKVLNVSNNIITVIDNFQDNIVDFQMHNTPNIEFRNSNIDLNYNDREHNRIQKLNYKKALHDFFKLKKKYEDKLHELKLKAYEKAPTNKMAKRAILAVKAPCINCKQNVGTIFEIKFDKYTAICGGKGDQKCDLDIHINTGDFVRYNEGIQLFDDATYNASVNIIQNKMNNIFGFTDDYTAKYEYKHNLEEYSVNNRIYKDMISAHNDLFNNINKDHKITENNIDIFNLTEQNNILFKNFNEKHDKSYITNIINNNEEIAKHARNIRNLRHEIMELNYDNGSHTNFLFQYPVLFDKLEINLQGTSPEVVKFNFGYKSKKINDTKPTARPKASPSINNNKTNFYKINIIIPFRNTPLPEHIANIPGQDRLIQLAQFKEYMMGNNGFISKVSNKLRKKGINNIIDITIVEQSQDNKRFNRGALLNIGFIEENDYDVFIFHDVDLLPNESMIDTYATKYSKNDIVHFAAGWARYKGPNYLGGVTLLGKNAFNHINGFPNNFWGWGGEDDELLRRINTQNFNNYITRIHNNKPYTDLEGIQTAKGKRSILKQEPKLLDNVIKNEQAKLHSTTWMYNGINTDNFYNIISKEFDDKFSNIKTIKVILDYDKLKPPVDETIIRKDLYK